MRFEEWFDRAKLYAVTRYCWDDLDEDQMKLCWGDNETVQQAVDWAAEKYDIEPVDDMFMSKPFDFSPFQGAKHEETVQLVARV